MVTLLRRGWAALSIIILASLLAAGPAGAQRPQPTSTDVGFVGIPEYTSAETGIPFFFPEVAQHADKAMSDMRNAAAKCDREAYDAALRTLTEKIETASMFDAPVNSSTKPEVAKAHNDLVSLREVVNRLPPFPENCTPPSTGSNNYGPFSVFVIGGGFVPLNSSGAVTGVDTFFGAGNFLIDNKSGSGRGQANFMGGFRTRAEMSTFIIRSKMNALFPTTEAPQPSAFGPSLFFETGIQSSFGAQSFIQPFGGVSTTPQGFGSNTVKENFQIPILIGVGVPLSGSGPTPVFLDLYGGMTISNSTQTLQGGEVGAPNGRGFFAESKRTTVDPTFGTGVRAVISDYRTWGGGLPPLIIGANAEFSFRSGNVVQAQSPNFPSQSYYGTVDPRANATFTIRVGIPFGGTR